MKMQSALLAMILGAAALAATDAKAAVVSYGSATAFAAATSGDTTYNFTGLVPNYSYNSYPTGVTVGSTTFNSSGSLFIIGPDAGYGAYNVPYLSGQLSGQSGVPNLTLTNPFTSAVGFDFGSYYTDNTGDTLAITVNGTSNFEVLLPSMASTTNFIGFTSTTPITSIAIANITDPIRSTVDLTDFTTGNMAVNGVPEPSTWAMFLLGFGGLAFLAFHKTRKEPTSSMILA